MRFIKAMSAGLVGASIGWAAGHVVCTALYLWLPPHLSQRLSADTVAIKLFGATVALAGVAAGLSFILGPWTAAGIASARNATIAALVAMGCAFFGSVVGMAAFTLIYKGLKPFDLEEALERDGVFLLFAAAFGLIAFAGGLWLARRWRPSGTTSIVSPTSLRVLALAALAGLGGGWIGHWLGYSLGIWISDVFALTGHDFKGMVVLATPLTTLVVLSAAVWLTLRFHAGYRGFIAIASRSAIALVLIAVAASTTMGASRRLDEAYEAITRAPLIFFNVRLPANAPVPTSKDGIAVEMRTEHGSQSGRLYDHEWIDREGDRALLKGVFDAKEPTRQRLVVLSLPGEPKRVFDLRLPRIPASQRTYGAWQHVDFLEEGGARRPASAADDFAIRFHAWRP
jgi:hypothetical protein